MRKSEYQGLKDHLNFNPNLIDKFDDKYHFLSNFYYENQKDNNGIVWITNEHYYQAMKTMDPMWREHIQLAKFPGEAKKRGRKCPMRPDWEKVKDRVMLNGLRMKFGQNPYIRRLLLYTDKARLVEGNTWGDTYWGVCGDKGENKLGILLMQVRDELRTIMHQRGIEI